MPGKRKGEEKKTQNRKEKEERAVRKWLGSPEQKSNSLFQFTNQVGGPKKKKTKRVGNNEEQKKTKNPAAVAERSGHGTRGGEGIKIQIEGGQLKYGRGLMGKKGSI